jgi:hypothetical protein
VGKINEIKAFAKLPHQEKQSARQLNTARSLHSLSTQASLYIPITTPQHHPRYVSANIGHPWQTSALQVTGIESITMPSRMRSLEGSQNVLQDIEAKLVGTGKRNIPQLRFEVADAHAKQSPWHEDDISLFPREQDKQLNGGKPISTFAEVEVIRDISEPEPERSDTIKDFGAHRKHRYVKLLMKKFPCLMDNIMEFGGSETLAGSIQLYLFRF